mmetsp:Transcript_113539/g.355081  ORF Transcript_113539/g.355081 Transcript_113539/m.355081 type:complete len:210 (+) Transcript_113539:857-1486(+)
MACRSCSGVVLWLVITARRRLSEQEPTAGAGGAEAASLARPARRSCSMRTWTSSVLSLSFSCASSRCCWPSRSSVEFAWRNSSFSLRRQQTSSSAAAWPEQPWARAASSCSSRRRICRAWSSARLSSSASAAWSSARCTTISWLRAVMRSVSARSSSVSASRRSRSSEKRAPSSSRSLSFIFSTSWVSCSLRSVSAPTRISRLWAVLAS